MSKFPKMAPNYEPHKLIYDMSSQEYHGTEGTYSSSQLKDLLEDEEIFIKKYIEKTIEREEIPAFSVGNYFHTGILEPEKLDVDCVVFPGAKRFGKAWDTFKAAHSGKTIVSPKQVDDAKRLISCVQDSPVAMGYLQDGKPEVSLFVKIVVYKGDIYAPKYNALMTRDGWKFFEKGFVPFGPNAKPKPQEFVIKVRADWLGDGFILDLKSTTGNARSAQQMHQKIKYYDYDLSAALYLDLFHLIRRDVKKFVWVFASKDCNNTRTYPMTENYRLIGRKKWTDAIKTLADCKRRNWETYDCEGVIEPDEYELWKIRPKETDDL